MSSKIDPNVASASKSYAEYIKNLEEFHHTTRTASDTVPNLIQVPSVDPYQSKIDDLLGSTAIQNKPWAKFKIPPELRLVATVITNRGFAPSIGDDNQLEQLEEKIKNYMKKNTLSDDDKKKLLDIEDALSRIKDGQSWLEYILKRLHQFSRG